MPVIPQFEPQDDFRVNPNLPAINPQMANETAEALARGTAGMSDQFNELAERYADQKRAIAASDARVDIENQMSAAAQRWSRVPDMDKAVAGFNDEAGTIGRQALQNIQDPLVQGMVSQRFDEARITHSLNVRTASFGMEASAARGNMDVQLAQLANTAGTAPTPEARAQALDDADLAIAARTPLYLAPEEAAKERIMFRSNVQKVLVGQYIKAQTEGPNVDRLSPIAISNAILDPQNFQGLLPSERETLSTQAIRLGEVIVSARQGAQAHNDAVAAKELTRAQASNAAQLIAQVTTAKPGAPGLDPGMLADAVKNQQISEAGMTAILAAQNRRDAGRDNTAVAMDLWRRAGSGEDVGDDALRAYGAGNLSHETAIALEKAVDAKTKGGETAVDKGNFNSLKTALGGYAIEQGIFAGENKEEKAQLWTAANIEWTQRVLSGREDSGAVLADMLQRYVKTAPIPAALPTPRLGPVSSLQDVGAVWAKTRAAKDAGRLDAASFSRERDLLQRYLQAFTDQQRAAAAAKTNTNKGGGGAQSLGPSGDLQ